MFILIGCEKDLYENITVTNKKHSIKKITFEEFKRNSNAFSKFKNLEVKKKSMLEGRMIYDSINDFTIDTEKIIVAEQDGNVWFTFPITRSYETSKTENLVLKSSANAQFIPMLLKYDFNEQDKLNVKNSQLVSNIDLKTEINFLEEIDFNDFNLSEEERVAGYFCVDILISSCSLGNPNHPGGYEADGSTCPYHTNQVVITICSSEGGDGNADNGDSGSGQTNNSESGNYSNESNTYGNTGSSGNNTNTNTNITGGVYGNGGTDGIGIITTPIIPAKTPKDIKLAFEADLTDTQLIWWNLEENQNIVNKIVEYLHINQTHDIEDEQTPTQFMQECLIRIIQSPTVFTSIKPFIIEKNIDDTLLDSCSKNVLDDIKSLSNLDFAKILARFDDTTNIFKVRIKTQSFNNTNNTVTAQTGYTYLNIKFDYTIEIKEDYIDGIIDLEPNSPPTQLSIASNIIHELIHAYFLSLVDEQLTSNPAALNNYQILFEEYVKKKHGANYTFAHHESIATLYHDIIASALQEFQTGIPVTNSNQKLQVYSDLAWAGLHETNIYNDINGPLTDIDRVRIQHRKLAEERNQEKGGQQPVGQPCN